MVATVVELQHYCLIKGRGRRVGWGRVSENSLGVIFKREKVCRKNKRRVKVPLKTRQESPD